MGVSDLLSHLLSRLLGMSVENKHNVGFLHYNTAQTLFDLTIRNDGTRTVSLLYMNRIAHLKEHAHLQTGEEMLRVIMQ